MNTVSPDEVRRLAGLARINLTESEVARIAGDLDNILSHVASLEAATTDTVIAEPVGPGSFRDDAAEDRIGVDTAKAAFPHSDDAFLKVPRVFKEQ